MKILCFLIAFILPYDVSGSVNSSFLLWPVPSQVTSLEGGVKMLNQDNFQFTLTISSINSAVLNNAFQRYMIIIFQNPTPFFPAGSSKNVQEELKALMINVSDDDEALNQNTDESYELNTKTGELTARTVYGALRGLETFSQLIFQNEDRQYQINSVIVTDSPRFQFRGTMIDTSRHFLPVHIILDHLDAMSYNKMNVLHWHIVDDQSFPYTSIKFPNMSLAGAYDKNHVYSQEDIATVIEFAKYRGIRVIVEFDTPGHTQSWGKGQPDLLTEHYSNGKPSGTYGPIDPTLESTWTFLEAFFTEVAQVFPDDYIHLGGDEVERETWKNNPNINKWLKEKKLPDNALQQYYETSLLKIISGMGKQAIVWQEVFDQRVEVSPDAVIQVWKLFTWTNDMSEVTKAGLKAILSACWYLNYIVYGEEGEDWKKFYECDPHNFKGNDAQKELVIGGEACMWAEYVDATNFLSRFWPRGSAVAERLWSRKTQTDVNAAEPRLNNMRCRLMSRHIPAEPIGPGYCSFEWPEAMHNSYTLLNNLL